MTLLLLPIGGWIENQLLLLVTQAAAGTVIYIGTAYITGSKILKDSLELIRKKKDMNNNTGLKVSVLMLTYNQERYINEAIRSVMLQETNFPFELVIGNDASTDCTGTIAQTGKKYPEQIVLFNRKKIWDCNRTSYKPTPDAGDNISPSARAMTSGQTNGNCKSKQISGYASRLFHLFHRVINYYEDRGTKSLSNGGQKQDTDISDLARSNYISNVSALFRRGLFGELPEWFARVSTYDYAIHLLNAQFGKIHYIKRPMAVYRQHEKQSGVKPEQTGNWTSHSLSGSC